MNFQTFVPSSSSALQIHNTRSDYRVYMLFTRERESILTDESHWHNGEIVREREREIKKWNEGIVWTK